MSEEEKLVAVVSPWEKLSELIKRKFRVESLPTEKKVMVWREDLQAEESLQAELQEAGVAEVVIRRERVTMRWQDVH